MPFTLINALPSPYGRKVAIALIEKGIEYDVRYDVPWVDGTCTPEYSPLEQLPILIGEDGAQVYDSTYILEWLETRFPAPALLPADDDRRLAAKHRQMLGERLMEISHGLIFEHHRPDPSDAWIERQTRKVLGVMAELDRLHAGREAKGDDDPIDVGDIAIATTLLSLEFVVEVGYCPSIDAFNWRDRYPALTRFIEALEPRPSFAATVPRMMEVDIGATVG